MGIGFAPLRRRREPGPSILIGSTPDACTTSPATTQQLRQEGRAGPAGRRRARRYQAGVYEALAESDYEPDWVAGISIGAINAAIIAGNAPSDRVAHLREFWEGDQPPTCRATAWPGT